MLEFMLLTVFIIAAFIAMAPFITRGVAGRWKAAGDAFGSGRLYDPERTLRCRFLPDSGTGGGLWYNADCYEERGCDCELAPYEVSQGRGFSPEQVACILCLIGCRTPLYCPSGNVDNCGE